MNIKEFEGKRWVEYNTVLIVIMTSIICLIIGLFILVWVLDTHAEEIKKNPLIFGASMYNISECNCFNQDGVFYFNQEKIWKVVRNIDSIDTDINWSKVEELN